jgi:hypothetical protein
MTKRRTTSVYKTFIYHNCFPGFLLRIPVLDSPDSTSLFDDRSQWKVETNDFPSELQINGEKKAINSNDEIRMYV